MRNLGGTVGINRPVIADNPARGAEDRGLKAQRCRPEIALEIAKIRAVYQPRGHLSHVVRLAIIHRHHAENIVGVVERRSGLSVRLIHLLVPAKARDDIARDLDPVGVIIGQILHQTSDFSVHFSPAKVFILGNLAGRRAQQGRASQHRHAIVFDPDHIIRQARLISPTGS